jgi:hypothetical protein
VAEDDKDDPALTAQLSSLAQALPELLERFRQMARSVGRADEATMSPSEPAQALDVTAALNVALEVARGELARRMRVVKIFTPAPPVLATEKQLGLMLLGMLVQAGQAVAPGRVDEHQLDIRVGTGEDGWARVELTVSGATVDGGAGSARLELPPVVAPKTELKA